MPAGDPDPADPLAQLLAGRFIDPDTGEQLGAVTRVVAIEPSLAGRAAELVTTAGLAGPLVVIDDVDTAAVLGDRVARELAAAQRITLPRGTHVDRETIARVAARVEPRTTGVVAVGSGTINDLSKMVGVARGIPQVVFATAPSMNGYTSLSASILEDGVKRSVRAATPLGVYFDLDVVANAPLRLIRAGLGDSVCRSTAQADWLLAHVLLDQPYRNAPFAMLAADEAALLADGAALVARDRDAIRHLCRTLVLSGFGMTISGGSYPASQGEHLVSHYIDMMRPAGVPDSYHGEQIAVASLAVARLQDRVLASATPPVMHASTVTRDDVIAHFGSVQGEACWRELEPKLLDDTRAAALTAKLAAGWDAIRARISAVTLGAGRMSEVLAAAGVPTTPAELGWSDALFADALTWARAIRNRFTILDLVAEST